MKIGHSIMYRRYHRRHVVNAICAHCALSALIQVWVVRLYALAGYSTTPAL